MHRQSHGILLALALVSGCSDSGNSGAVVPPEPCTKTDALAGFSSRFADVGGEQVHYMIGGSGPALVLLHGWPAAWVSWKKIMPALATRFTVIAPDLRGLGDSSVPADFQLDVPKAADNIFQLVQQLGQQTIFLVGHDWGGAVGYSYALAHREQVMKFAILESLPTQTFTEVQLMQPQTFWFNWFQRIADLPEELVAGKERPYLSWFYKNFAHRQDAIAPEDIDHYICTYTRPGSMRAGFEYYRDEEIGAQSQEALLASGGKLAMPVLAVGGQYSQADGVASAMNRVAQQVTPLIVPDAGHWVVEENSDFVLNGLQNFLTKP